MPIEGDALVDSDDDQDGDRQRQQPDPQQRTITYVLHPNCAIEEM